MEMTLSSNAFISFFIVLFFLFSLGEIALPKCLVYIFLPVLARLSFLEPVQNVVASPQGKLCEKLEENVSM